MFKNYSKEKKNGIAVIVISVLFISIVVAQLFYRQHGKDQVAAIMAKGDIALKRIDSLYEVFKTRDHQQSKSHSYFYVVDGIPLADNASDIRRADVANIQIVPDADAVSIYGERALNGVILITTKASPSL